MASCKNTVDCKAGDAPLTSKGGDIMVCDAFGGCGALHNAEGKITSVPLQIPVGVQGRVEWIDGKPTLKPDVLDPEQTII